MTQEYRTPDDAEAAAQMAWIRKRVREEASTAGVPLVLGTDMADNLADLVDGLLRLNADRKALGLEISDLERQLQLARRGDVTKLAAAMRAGESVEDPPSLRELEDSIARKRRKMHAIGVATDDTRAQITRRVGANAIAFTAEITARRRTLQAAAVDAVDALESAWAAVLAADASLDWISRGGTGKTSHRNTTLKLAREPDLAMVLGALRGAIAYEKPEPRPTKDEDGDDVTGWNAYGKLARGGGGAIGVVGNMLGNRPEPALPGGMTPMQDDPARDARRAREGRQRPAKAEPAKVEPAEAGG